MKITEEMVRELQKKVDVTYEEAEYTLNRTKGDINAAHYLIMRRRNSSWERFKESAHDVFVQMLKYRLIITRKSKVLLDLPLLLLFLLVALDGFYRHLLPLVLIFIGILVFECEVRIEKSQEIDPLEDGLFRARKSKSEKNATPTANTSNTSSPQELVPVTQATEIKIKPDQKEKDKKDDDYFEIVIEE
ncbi:MAG: hypothetical protein H7X94_07860 [Vallitaleaceae bacterium]|nr:hypothetical protein [Vallitaleaceae bacterium]